jgi:hypothetical protein
MFAYIFINAITLKVLDKFYYDFNHDVIKVPPKFYKLPQLTTADLISFL